MNEQNNFAFIDSNNLYQSLSKDIIKNGQKQYTGWRLDYCKFRIYLKDKYQVEKAFLFIGFMPGKESLYERLKQAGFVCVFKPTLELKDGKVKGNVDAELVLYAMIEYQNFYQAVIVSGDGDFYCLVKYFLSNQKLKKVIIPNRYNYSCLLDRLSKPDNNILAFINDLKNKLSL